jgi:tRNA-Thr(GGU) m(6)t(6)A37 methyltransferase TsaA
MAPNAEAVIELRQELSPGLLDLEGFERIWVLYWADQTSQAQLQVRPFLDNKEHGIFATRSPSRPNPIGLAAVELRHIEGNRLHIRGVDMLDQTPVLDIKPYVPAFDRFDAARIGWLSGKTDHLVFGDDRFHANPPP